MVSFDKGVLVKLMLRSIYFFDFFQMKMIVKSQGSMCCQLRSILLKLKSLFICTYLGNSPKCLGAVHVNIKNFHSMFVPNIGLPHCVLVPSERYYYSLLKRCIPLISFALISCSMQYFYDER